MHSPVTRFTRCLGLLVGLGAASSWAKPPAPATFCAQYPTAPACVSGQPACTYCHLAPPARNAFGATLEANLAVGANRPLSDDDFAAALPAALTASEAGDADADGVSNLVEVQRGTLPADPNSFPDDIACAGGANPQFRVCHYDYRFVYRRVLLDFAVSHRATQTW